MRVYNIGRQPRLTRWRKHEANVCATNGGNLLLRGLLAVVLFILGGGLQGSQLAAIDVNFVVVDLQKKIVFKRNGWALDRLEMPNRMRSPLLEQADYYYYEASDVTVDENNVVTVKDGATKHLYGERPNANETYYVFYNYDSSKTTSKFDLTGNTSYAVGANQKYWVVGADGTSIERTNADYLIIDPDENGRWLVKPAAEGVQDPYNFRIHSKAYPTKVFSFSKSNTGAAATLQAVDEDTYYQSFAILGTNGNCEVVPGKCKLFARGSVDTHYIWGSDNSKVALSESTGFNSDGVTIRFTRFASYFIMDEEHNVVAKCASEDLDHLAIPNEMFSPWVTKYSYYDTEENAMNATYGADSNISEMSDDADDNIYVRYTYDKTAFDGTKEYMITSYRQRFIALRQNRLNGYNNSVYEEGDGNTLKVEESHRLFTITGDPYQAVFKNVWRTSEVDGDLTLSANMGGNDQGMTHRTPTDIASSLSKPNLVDRYSNRYMILSHQATPQSGDEELELKQNCGTDNMVSRFVFVSNDGSFRVSPRLIHASDNQLFRITPKTKLRITYHILNSNKEEIFSTDYSEVPGFTIALPAKAKRYKCTYGSFYTNAALSGDPVTTYTEDMTDLWIEWTGVESGFPITFSDDDDTKWYAIELMTQSANGYRVLVPNTNSVALKYNVAGLTITQDQESKEKVAEVIEGSGSRDRYLWAFYGDPYNIRMVNREESNEAMTWTASSSDIHQRQVNNYVNYQAGTAAMQVWGIRRANNADNLFTFCLKENPDLYWYVEGDKNKEQERYLTLDFLTDWDNSHYNDVAVYPYDIVEMAHVQINVCNADGTVMLTQQFHPTESALYDANYPSKYSEGSDFTPSMLPDFMQRLYCDYELLPDDDFSEAPVEKVKIKSGTSDASPHQIYFRYLVNEDCPIKFCQSHNDADHLWYFMQTDFTGYNNYDRNTLIRESDTNGNWWQQNDNVYMHAANSDEASSMRDWQYIMEKEFKEDRWLWAFEGDPYGFRLYNKAVGKYIVVSESPISDEGSPAYLASMTDSPNTLSSFQLYKHPNYAATSNVFTIMQPRNGQFTYLTCNTLNNNKDLRFNTVSTPDGNYCVKAIEYVPYKWQSVRLHFRSTTIGDDYLVTSQASERIRLDRETLTITPTDANRIVINTVVNKEISSRETQMMEDVTLLSWMRKFCHYSLWQDAAMTIPYEGNSITFGSGHEEDGNFLDIYVKYDWVGPFEFSENYKKAVWYFLDMNFDGLFQNSMGNVANKHHLLYQPTGGTGNMFDKDTPESLYAFNDIDQLTNETKIGTTAMTISHAVDAMGGSVYKKYLWAFVGNPYSFRIMNRAQGSDQYMHTNGTANNSAVNFNSNSGYSDWTIYFNSDESAKNPLENAPAANLFQIALTSDLTKGWGSEGNSHVYLGALGNRSNSLFAWRYLPETYVDATFHLYVDDGSGTIRSAKDIIISHNDKQVKQYDVVTPTELPAWVERKYCTYTLYPTLQDLQDNTGAQSSAALVNYLKDEYADDEPAVLEDYMYQMNDVYLKYTFLKHLTAEEFAANPPAGFATYDDYRAEMCPIVIHNSVSSIPSSESLEKGKECTLYFLMVNQNDATTEQLQDLHATESDPLASQQQFLWRQDGNRVGFSYDNEYTLTEADKTIDGLKMSYHRTAEQYGSVVGKDIPATRWLWAFVGDTYNMQLVNIEALEQGQPSYMTIQKSVAPARGYAETFQQGDYAQLTSGAPTEATSTSWTMQKTYDTEEHECFSLMLDKTNLYAQIDTVPTSPTYRQLILGSTATDDDTPDDTRLRLQRSFSIKALPYIPTRYENVKIVIRRNDSGDHDNSTGTTATFDHLFTEGDELSDNATGTDFGELSGVPYSLWRKFCQYRVMGGDSWKASPDHTATVKRQDTEQTFFIDYRLNSDGEAIFTNLDYNSTTKDPDNKKVFFMDDFTSVNTYNIVENHCYVQLGKFDTDKSEQSSQKLGKWIEEEYATLRSTQNRFTVEQPKYLKFYFTGDPYHTRVFRFDSPGENLAPMKSVQPLNMEKYRWDVRFQGPYVSRYRSDAAQTAYTEEGLFTWEMVDCMPLKYKTEADATKYANTKPLTFALRFKETDTYHRDYTTMEGSEKSDTLRVKDTYYYLGLPRNYQDQSSATRSKMLHFNYGNPTQARVLNGKTRRLHTQNSDTCALTLIVPAKVLVSTSKDTQVNGTVDKKSLVQITHNESSEFYGIKEWFLNQPDNLKRQFCNYLAVYKDDTHDNEIVENLVEVTNEANYIYPVYELAADNPFSGELTATKTGADDDAAKWYNLNVDDGWMFFDSDWENKDEYGRDNSSSLRSQKGDIYQTYANGNTWKYHKGLHWAFYGDPYEFYAVSRRQLADGSGTKTSVFLDGSVDGYVGVGTLADQLSQRFTFMKSADTGTSYETQGYFISYSWPRLTEQDGTTETVGGKTFTAYPYYYNLRDRDLQNRYITMSYTIDGTRHEDIKYRMFLGDNYSRGHLTYLVQSQGKDGNYKTGANNESFDCILNIYNGENHVVATTGWAEMPRTATGQSMISTDMKRYGCTYTVFADPQMTHIYDTFLDENPNATEGVRGEGGHPYWAQDGCIIYAFYQYPDELYSTEGDRRFVNIYFTWDNAPTHYYWDVQKDLDVIYTDQYGIGFRSKGDRDMRVEIADYLYAADCFEKVSEGRGDYLLAVGTEEADLNAVITTATGQETTSDHTDRTSSVLIINTPEKSKYDADNRRRNPSFVYNYDDYNDYKLTTYPAGRTYYLSGENAGRFVKAATAKDSARASYVFHKAGSNYIESHKEGWINAFNPTSYANKDNTYAEIERQNATVAYDEDGNEVVNRTQRMMKWALIGDPYEFQLKQYFRNKDTYEHTYLYSDGIRNDMEEHPLVFNVQESLPDQVIDDNTDAEFQLATELSAGQKQGFTFTYKVDKNGNGYLALKDEHTDGRQTWQVGDIKAYVTFDREDYGIKTDQTDDEHTDEVGRAVKFTTTYFDEAPAGTQTWKNNEKRGQRLYLVGSQTTNPLELALTTAGKTAKQFYIAPMVERSSSVVFHLNIQNTEKAQYNTSHPYSYTPAGTTTPTIVETYTDEGEAEKIAAHGGASYPSTLRDLQHHGFEDYVIPKYGIDNDLTVPWNWQRQFCNYTYVLRGTYEPLTEGGETVYDTHGNPVPDTAHGLDKTNQGKTYTELPDDALEKIAVFDVYYHTTDDFQSSTEEVSWWYNLSTVSSTILQSNQARFRYKDQVKTYALPNADEPSRQYTDDWLWAVEGDPYGFLLHNRYATGWNEVMTVENVSGYLTHEVQDYVAQNPTWPLPDSRKTITINGMHNDSILNTATGKFEFLGTQSGSRAILDADSYRADRDFTTLSQRARNSVMEMMMGNYTDAFLIHPVESYIFDSYPAFFQSMFMYDGGTWPMQLNEMQDRNAKSSVAANWTLGQLTARQLLPYFERAGYVGALDPDVAEQYMSLRNKLRSKPTVGDLRQAQRLVHNLELDGDGKLVRAAKSNLVDLVPGYYRITPLSDLGEVQAADYAAHAEPTRRYVSGHTFLDETGPMHFYETLQSGRKFSDLTPGTFTSTVSSGQNLEVPSAYYDPSTIYRFTQVDGEHWNLSTQGMNVDVKNDERKMVFSTVPTDNLLRFDDIGASLYTFRLRTPKGIDPVTGDSIRYFSSDDGHRADGSSYTYSDETFKGKTAEWATRVGNELDEDATGMMTTAWLLQRVGSNTDEFHHELPLRLRMTKGYKTENKDANGNYPDDNKYYASLMVPYDVRLNSLSAVAFTGEQIFKGDGDQWKLQLRSIGLTTNRGNGQFVPSATPVVVRASVVHPLTGSDSYYTTDEFGRSSTEEHPIVGYIEMSLPNNEPTHDAYAENLAKNKLQGVYLEQLLGSDGSGGHLDTDGRGLSPNTNEQVYVFGLQQNSFNVTALKENATVGFYPNKTKQRTDPDWPDVSNTHSEESAFYVLHNRAYTLVDQSALAATSRTTRSLPEFIFADFGDGIEDQQAKESQQPAVRMGVYDLSGRRLRTKEQVADGTWRRGLTPGVYILNGRRITIR